MLIQKHCNGQHNRMSKLPKGFVNIVPVEEPTLNMLLILDSSMYSRTAKSAQQSILLVQYTTHTAQQNMAEHATVYKKFAVSCFNVS